MNLDKFKELRVVVKNSINPKYNGRTFVIARAELNENREPILFAMVDEVPCLLALDLNQIDYVKVYHSWITQYYNKLNKTQVTFLFDYGDNKKYLSKIGIFEIYRKEKDILSLVD